MIKSISGLRGDQIDWISFGSRVKKIRLAQGIDKLQASHELELGGEEQLVSLERGFSGRNRKDVNIVFRISQLWNLSLNWLLNGTGTPHGEDPVEMLPPTLIVQRGAGIRKSDIRAKAEEGGFSDEVLEFVLAIDKYKSQTDTLFPRTSQLYEVILALGYRKTAPARIAPLGYIIEHQRWAEKLKQIQEVDAYIAKEEEEDARLQEAYSQRRVADEIKERQIKAANPTPRFLTDHTLSEGERKRRQRISETSKGSKTIKQYLITDPEGKSYLTERGLNEFCREHGLVSNTMSAVATGRKKHHRGWTAEHIPKFVQKTRIEVNGQD